MIRFRFVTQPKRIQLIITLFLALVLACSSPPGTMSDSTYVNVMVELITNKNAPGTDTAANAQRRREALEKFKITEDDLLKKTAVLAEDPVHFSEVWGKVRVKLAPGG